MTVKILHGGRETEISDAALSGENLWLTPTDLLRATGWQWQPEGFCRGEACVPLPAGAARSQLVRGEGSGLRLNLTGVARHLGQPVALSAEHGVLALGEAPEATAERLLALEAPDFTLPDLDGRLHSLSAFRGRKVFLLAWASW